MPKPKGRPKGSQTEPLVSLSPLEPEEALAGLLQVKPGKENQMPKFTHEDRVRITGGEYAGRTGAIFGNPSRVFGVPYTPVAEGQEIAGEEAGSFLYQVDLDGTDETVPVIEADLEAA